jgi:hypothetical protein
MIQPFSNASEYMAWDERNCCHCVHYGACDIQGALAYSVMTITGEITEAIAAEAGLPGLVCKAKVEA